MAKRIHITEDQYKVMLKEYDASQFKLSELDKLPTGVRYAYCKKFLGNPIGEGCGRAVFEIGDGEVIKIIIPANAKDGFWQNKNEWDVSQEYGSKYSVFPKVFLHSGDFSWITCEKVLPMYPTDCERILGIPYRKQSCYDKNTYLSKKPYGDYSKYKRGIHTKKIGLEDVIECATYNATKWKRKMFSDEEIEKIMNTVDTEPNVGEIYNFIANETDGRVDLHYNNFGIAMRNGTPWVVILDSGAVDIERINTPSF